MHIVSEEDALLIWARAAQLQEEAAAAARPRRDELERAAASTSGLILDPATRAPAGMYLASEITRAAIEAGIDAESIAIALAEHEAHGAAAQRVAQELSPATRAHMIGHDATSLRVSRVIPESPEVVLERLRTLAAKAPYQLEFDVAIGAHPRDGGVLRFNIPQILSPDAATGAARPFSWFHYHATRMQVGQVHVTMTPRGHADAPGCELNIILDLRRGQTSNVRWLSRAAAAIAGLSAVAGGIVGVASMGGVPGFLTGLAAGGAFGLAYRQFLAAINRWEHGKARGALSASLQALLAQVQRPSDVDRVFGGARDVRPRLLPQRDDRPSPMIRGELRSVFRPATA
jgi:hypothetical protein